jgi:FkbM family methyltransferase
MQLVKIARNESVLRDFGAYPSAITLGGGHTENQRNFRTGGLYGFEAGTQATLLTLVQLAAAHRPIEFFDVGAHIGMHSLIVSTVYPTDRVHVTAFEPTPRTAAICRTLAGANQRQIRIERCAISDQDGTAELYISPWETSNSLMAGFRPALESISIPTVSLDSYCAKHSVLPSVIKIDVETYEPHVLLGGLATFERARPSIVCEILDGADPEAIERALTALASLGYHQHRWNRAEGWSECSIQDIIDQVPHDGNDWLLTPDPIDDRFRAALTEWRSAIAECKGDPPTVREQYERPAAAKPVGRSARQPRLRRIATGRA